MTNLLDKSAAAIRVLDRASSLMAYWDRDLICRYANAAHQQWFGVTAEVLLGMKLEALLGRELFLLNKPHIDGALDGVAQQFERRISGPDGVQRHSLTRYHPDVADGVVLGFVAEVSDVSALKVLENRLLAEAAEHRHTHAALERKKSALQIAQRLGRIGSWEWELDADITTWSPELYRLFGHDPSLLPPTYAEQSRLYSAASWRRLQAAVAMAVRHGQSYVLELEYRRPDGGGGWLEARGEVDRDQTGTITGLHGTVQDVSAIALAKRALRSQSQRLEMALEAAQLGLWSYDHDRGSGEIALENPRVRDMLGMKPVSSALRIDHLCKDLLHPDDVAAFRLAVRRARRAQGYFRFVGRCRHRCSGQWRWIECAGMPAPDSRGVRRFFGTVADISERMLVREALDDVVSELEQNDLRKTEFLAVLGHELRNCVAPLSSGLHTLTRGSLEPSVLHVKGMMQRQIAQMARLIDDLYDLRRLQTGQLTLNTAIVSLNTLVVEALDMCRTAIERASHRLRVVLPTYQVVVRGDAGRLTQAIVNLLNNAIKFTPAGGAIAVELGTIGASWARLEVVDNGVGIAPEALAQVFGLYAQGGTADSRARGLGIGLHLVKHIVEMHGGSVCGASDGLQRGSTFTVQLPLHAADSRTTK